MRIDRADFYMMVDPQVYQAGRGAAESMLALLRGDDVPERITVPARWIARYMTDVL